MEDILLFICLNCLEDCVDSTVQTCLNLDYLDDCICTHYRPNHCYLLAAFQYMGIKMFSWDGP